MTWHGAWHGVLQVQKTAITQLVSAPRDGSLALEWFRSGAVSSTLISHLSLAGMGSIPHTMNSTVASEGQAPHPRILQAH